MTKVVLSSRESLLARPSDLSVRQPPHKARRNHAPINKHLPLPASLVYVPGQHRSIRLHTGSKQASRTTTAFTKVHIDFTSHQHGLRKMHQGDDANHTRDINANITERDVLWLASIEVFPSNIQLRENEPVHNEESYSDHQPNDRQIEVTVVISEEPICDLFRHL